MWCGDAMAFERDKETGWLSWVGQAREKRARVAQERKALATEQAPAAENVKGRSGPPPSSGGEAQS